MRKETYPVCNNVALVLTLSLLILTLPSMVGCVSQLKSSQIAIPSVNMGDCARYTLTKNNEIVCFSLSSYKKAPDGFDTQHDTLCIDVVSKSQIIQTGQYYIDKSTKEPVLYEYSSSFQYYPHMGVENLLIYLTSIPFAISFYIENTPLYAGFTLSRSVLGCEINLSCVHTTSEQANLVAVFETRASGNITVSFTFERNSPYPIEVIWPTTNTKMIKINESRGTQPIIWNTCISNHNLIKNQRGNYTVWTKNPDDGQMCTLPLKLSEAIKEVRNSRNFQMFINDHPEAYLIEAKYSYFVYTVNDEARWNLTYGSSQQERYFGVVIRKNYSGITITMLENEGRYNKSYAWMWDPDRTLLSNISLTVQGAIDIIQPKLSDGRMLDFLHWCVTGMPEDIGTPGELLWEGGFSGEIGNPNKPLEKVKVSGITGQIIMKTKIIIQ